MWVDSAVSPDSSPARPFSSADPPSANQLICDQTTQYARLLYVSRHCMCIPLLAVAFFTPLSAQRRRSIVAYCGYAIPPLPLLANATTINRFTQFALQLFLFLH